MNPEYLKIIDDKRQTLIETADYIWEHAEPAFMENKSADCFADKGLLKYDPESYASGCGVFRNGAHGIAGDHTGRYPVCRSAYDADAIASSKRVQTFYTQPGLKKTDRS